MNSAAFALVLLAAGYLFLRHAPFTRATIFRTDGHALYFTVVASSLAIAAYTAVLLHEIGKVSLLREFLATPAIDLLSLFATEEKAQPLGLVAITAVPVATGLALLLRLPVRACESLQEQLLLTQNSTSELEEFLWKTASRGIPVMLTLGSGKVYVGTTIRAAAPRDERRWLRVEPFLSGYRDETQRFQLTTSYAWLHSGDANPGDLPIEDFDVVLPFDDIKSAHAFDLPTYLARFETVPNTHATVSLVKEAPSRPRHTSKAVRLYYGYVSMIALLPFGSFFWGAPAGVAVAASALLFGLAAALDESR